MKRRVQTGESLKSNASGDFLRLNPQIMGLGRVSDGNLPPDEAQKAGLPKAETMRETRPRTRRETLEARLDKTEMRYYDAFLRATDGLTNRVLAQEVRLPLEGGGVYIPDFVLLPIPLDGISGERRPVAIEIKGGYRGPGWEQGYERYRRAAAQYKDCMCFVLCTWSRKDDMWDVEVYDGGKEVER